MIFYLIDFLHIYILSLYIPIIFICKITPVWAKQIQKTKEQTPCTIFSVVRDIKLGIKVYIFKFKSKVCKRSHLQKRWNLSKPKTCLTQTVFTIPSTYCLCNLNLCKPNTCLNFRSKFFSHKGVRLRQVLLYLKLPLISELPHFGELLIMILWPNGVI